MNNNKRLAKLYGLSMQPFPIKSTEKPYWLARMKKIDNRMTVKWFLWWWNCG